MYNKRLTFIVIWLWPTLFWAYSLLFVWTAQTFSADCVVNNSFAEGCFLFGKDVSQIVYNREQFINWGLIVLVVPWTIIVGLMGLPVLIFRR